MKLGFTTLGCTTWDMDTIVAKAVAYGFDGVDFRGYKGHLNIYELPEFTTEAADTAARFDDAGLELPCLSSSAWVCANPAEAIDQIRCYAPLCEKLGASYIRVFGGAAGDDVSREQAIATAVDTLNQGAAIAAEHNVALLLETHDDWVRSEFIRPIMEQLDSPSVGVLWDTYNPYGAIAEPLDVTWETLGRWIKYTHWKDAVATDDKGGHQLCRIGKGEFPLAECFSVLREGGYDGYLTLEWEKQWHPELDEPELAYPEFVHVMKNIMA